MSDTTSFSSLLISLLVVETSVFKTVLETTVKLNDSNYLLLHKLFTSSSVLRTSWLTSLSLHLLLHIRLIRPGFLEIIV